MHKLILILILFAAPSQSMHLLQRLKEKGIATQENIAYTYKTFPFITRFITGATTISLAGCNYFLWDKSKLAALLLNILVIGKTINVLDNQGAELKIKRGQEFALLLNSYITYDMDMLMERVNMCIRRGANLNSKEHNVLLNALKQNKLVQATFLRLNGADPHCKIENNKTLLMLLAKQEDDSDTRPAMQWLIDQNIDVHARDDQQHTALDLAHIYNRPERVELLQRYQ